LFSFLFFTCLNFCISLWNALHFLCSYKQKELYKYRTMFYFTLFSKGLSSNLHTRVHAHTCCALFFYFFSLKGLLYHFFGMSYASMYLIILFE
jgi:valyl-tRNA synthetase